MKPKTQVNRGINAARLNAEERQRAALLRTLDLKESKSKKVNSAEVPALMASFEAFVEAEMEKMRNQFPGLNISSRMSDQEITTTLEKIKKPPSGSTLPSWEEFDKAVTALDTTCQKKFRESGLQVNLVEDLLIHRIFNKICSMNLEELQPQNNIGRGEAFTPHPLL